MKHLHSRQTGFSLIEVLIALVVLGIGMLGMGKMLMVSMKSNSTAYANTQAMSLASAMLDRMRANRATALLGASSNYSLPTLISSSTYGGGPNCLTVACSSTALASSDVANWLGSLSASNGLPSGQGSITFTNVNSQVGVSIRV
jgi:type IV pilus assembly protein PilV